MNALINTLNLTVNIHRNATEATADLAEFLMAMSQMELFPDCDEEAIAEPTEDTTPVVAGSPDADDAPVMDFNTVHAPAPVMDFNTVHAPAPVMDFNTVHAPAPVMDFNTVHADRLQEKICMRLTDNYREVGQAIDDSRLKDKQASVIDACRSVIDGDTKVLLPQNSRVFRMMDTSDVYISTFRRWVNYYVASGNYGATAYTSREEAREQSTDSSQSIVQEPFIELSVELLRVKLRVMGVTFN